MRVSRPLFLAAAALAAATLLPSASAESDRAAAARILGPNWQHLSRRAAIIAAATVLSDAAPSRRQDRPVPTVELRLSIDRAIAGVRPGQILTLREWTGALAAQRPMRRGQRFLLFLYRPSRLGLTSPVAGAQGQIPLDSTGAFAIQPSPPANSTRANSPPPDHPADPTRTNAAPLLQLERAIRAARTSARAASSTTSLRARGE